MENFNEQLELKEIFLKYPKIDRVNKWKRDGKTDVLKHIQREWSEWEKKVLDKYIDHKSSSAIKIKYKKKPVPLGTNKSIRKRVKIGNFFHCDQK